MRWTKNTPKKAGFYWYKPPDPDEEPQVLRVSLFAGAPDLVAECPGYEGDYTMDDQWASTESFGRDDLLVLAKVADQTHSWICAQSQ